MVRSITPRGGGLLNMIALKGEDRKGKGWGESPNSFLEKREKKGAIDQKGRSPLVSGKKEKGGVALQNNSVNGGGEGDRSSEKI